MKRSIAICLLALACSEPEEEYTPYDACMDLTGGMCAKVHDKRDFILAGCALVNDEGELEEFCELYCEGFVTEDDRATKEQVDACLATNDGMDRCKHVDELSPECNTAVTWLPCLGKAICDVGEWWR